MLDGKIDNVNNETKKYKSYPKGEKAMCGVTEKDYYTALYKSIECALNLI